ncbi:ABC transporter permease [Candidatus Stoquefichus massiliensis]|uniref:ABC transporter permease n=1 Tax=Candidatus Stoquefichus massiliensis TaxID=1470350 RepID=UPI000486EE88|nr:ABC transporter permease [Candidatus Stoquefichus massiliensis]
MGKYVVKRILIGIITLFVLSSATFFLMKATPGSPISGEKFKTAEARKAAEERYNLDKPVVTQYALYLEGVAQGDLGESMVHEGRTVTYYIGNGFPVTAKLAFVAFIVAVTVGITLGTTAALSRKKWVNNVCMFIATIGVSVPSFLIAMLLVVIFGVNLKMFPFIGLATPAHYILPALALSLYPISMISRLTRSSMLEVMKQDYIILARSKGTPYKKVIIKHALKNAMLPVITYIGPMFAFLLTGSLVVETIFAIPGLGSSFVTSVMDRDYPLIMGMTIFLGILIISFNLITDIVSAMVDPRIKLK